MYDVCSANNSQCVVEWEGQSFSPNDLKQYGNLMGVPALNIPSPEYSSSQLRVLIRVRVK